MLRLLALGFLVYGIGIGFKNGWLVIHWSPLLHDVGFTDVNREEPMNWSEFIRQRFEKNDS
ncbi:hypothetical protein [Prochlorococcus marinus]|uniref:Uncharacterized protein n=1 Tax=Prochlorococcus marinus (strain MIT 9211) TaxID=93059 RepID=A9B9I5_PROM4|nr:hypothetical protein [Prochlorococcus marinus]ABX07960.1 Hypothetical protein P9211_00291 [Prochlorococcus marinus str. MIT 9211]